MSNWVLCTQILREEYSMFEVLEPSCCIYVVITMEGPSNYYTVTRIFPSLGFTKFSWQPQNDNMTKYNCDWLKFKRESDRSAITDQALNSNWSNSGHIRNCGKNRVLSEFSLNLEPKRSLNFCWHHGNREKELRPLPMKLTSPSPKVVLYKHSIYVGLFLCNNREKPIGHQPTHV